MPKETSEEVSALAAEYINISIADIYDEEKLSDDEKRRAEIVVKDIRALAASCLSQDETPEREC